MRRIVPGLLLLVLAGCGGSGSGPGLLTGGPAPLPTQNLQAVFTPGGVVDVIDVNAVDQQPMRSAFLVAPDGATTPAGPIDVARSPSQGTGQYVKNDPFRGVLSGSGGPAAFSGAGIDVEANAALRGNAQLLMTVSQASIQLPDPVAYRRDWRNYRVRASFGPNPSNLITREIAAPPPPPAS